jgi:hypothetical protein
MFFSRGSTQAGWWWAYFSLRCGMRSAKTKHPLAARMWQSLCIVPHSKQMPDFDQIHRWCEDHQAWVVHTPASCTLCISREEAESAQALAAVLAGFESDE